jgi:cell division cycle protein 37
VEDFAVRIQKRAVEKRKEMDAAERKKRMETRKNGVSSEDEVPIGPGGLDPFEVLESLPQELRDAFESQDMNILQEVLHNMKPSEAK